MSSYKLEGTLSSEVFSDGEAITECHICFTLLLMAHVKEHEAWHSKQDKLKLRVDHLTEMEHGRLHAHLTGSEGEKTRAQVANAELHGEVARLKEVLAAAEEARNKWEHVSVLQERLIKFLVKG